MIAGFPGETEEEFEQTRIFLDEIGFYETHVFRYSRREGTAAAALKDQIPEKIKEKRSAVLIEDAAARKKCYEERHENASVRVLLEEKRKIQGRICYTGHTMEYIDCVLPSDKPGLEGQVVSGSLTFHGAPEGYMLLKPQ